MTKVAKILVLLICFASLFSVSFAQKRKAQRSTKQTNVKTTEVAKSEITAGAEKVSVQIVNLTKFIYVLGGVARGIEEIDERARQGQASKALIDKNEEFKRRTIQSIRDLRAGLAALEVEFRTKESLKPYLPKIANITDEAGTAEDQALAGNFTEAGRTLLGIIEKLTATLTAMSAR